MDQSRFERLNSSWTEILGESNSIRADLTAASLWNTIDWRIVQAPPSAFQTSRDHYLQIKVELQPSRASCASQFCSNQFNSNPRFQCTEDLEEEDLSTDTQTINEKLSNSFNRAATNARNDITLSSDIPIISYRGHIDVILHPIYNVPCPYIRLFDANGQPATAESIQRLIWAYRKGGIGGRIPDIGGEISNGDVLPGDVDRSPDMNSNVSASSDDSGNITPLRDNDGSHWEVEYSYEEHPYLLVPCLCLHVCGIGASLALIQPAASIEVLPIKSIPTCPLMSIEALGLPNITDAVDTSDRASVRLGAEDVIESDSIKPRNEDTRKGTLDSSSRDRANITTEYRDFHCADDNNDGSSDLYLLSWFALVGPPLGIDISVAFYSAASKLL